MIVHSIDGIDFFYNEADGALATQDWAAVGLAGARRPPSAARAARSS